jgi:hypothetical protein
LSELDKATKLVIVLLLVLLPVALGEGHLIGSSQTHTTTLSYTSTETITSTVNSPSVRIVLMKACFILSDPITGTVLQADYSAQIQPIAGMSVDLFNSSMKRVAHTETDNYGTFSLSMPSNASLGMYWIGAYGQGSQAWVQVQVTNSCGT